MPDYQYTALDRSGKKLNGTLTGRDIQDAAGKVRSQGYYPIDISPASGGTSKAITEKTNIPASGGEQLKTILASGKKVPRVHILLFTRELADLIDAGLPIDRALSVLVEQTENDALQDMVRVLQGDIRAGKPLSEALRRYPREFPNLYANMIRAGEISGQLPAVMTRLADFLEKEAVRRSQVVAAMTYPMVLISIATLAVIFLLSFVIPRLQSVFTDLHAALPLPTRMLLGLSAFISRDWWIMLLIIGTGVIAFKAWTGTIGGKRTYDSFLLSAPLFGKLTTKLVMARFVRTLGTLLAGGVPILESLEISSSAVGNTATEQLIHHVKNGVRQGETLSGAMEKTGGFLPLVSHMTAVGEETGRLAQMLIRTSNTLDFEVDNAMRRLTSLVEPLVVLLMGSFVGFVVLSILMPIFEANTMVK